MKKKLFVLIGLIGSVFFSNGQQLIDSGKFGDYSYGLTNKYHLNNIKLLFDKSSVDTVGYTCVGFFDKGDLIERMVTNEKQTYVTMEIVDDKITSYTVNSFNAENPQLGAPKIYVVFYFSSRLTNKTTYYFYRYG